MAQFFKAKPNRSKQLSSKIILDVNQVDHFGAGIAQYQGKVVFIPGALPDEKVTVQLVEQKKQYARAKLLQINVASEQRVIPSCPHYQHCGGCDFQHLDVNYQRQLKQEMLNNMLEKQIDKSVNMAPWLIGDEWHYRRRARLATSYDKSTNKFVLGFRKEKSKAVIAISQCKVLTTSLSELIRLFADLLAGLTLRKSMGHLELIHVSNGVFAVLRLTQNISDSDKQQLAGFEESHGVQILLQNNDGQCLSLDGQCLLPHYVLDDDSMLQFKPGNFIQVNADINQQMITQAMQWLAPKAGERILDLFCGVGNFSLPLAKLGAEVIGVEGVAEMVKQAQTNAQLQGLNNVSFYHDDLSSNLSVRPWLGKIDKLLLDPARAGAYESLQWLKKMKPSKVLYVSCNPVSFVRDSQLLLSSGYRMKKLGLMDMFPQTHHMESMALFQRKD